MPNHFTSVKNTISLSKACVEFVVCFSVTAITKDHVFHFRMSLHQGAFKLQLVNKTSRIERLFRSISYLSSVANWECYWLQIACYSREGNGPGKFGVKREPNTQISS